MENTMVKNPLGTEPVGKLLQNFAVPSIIAMLVSSLYNIVDQFFIGRSVGELGNAATNIVFPLTISCISIALLFGIGGASAFNLAMGRKKTEDAAYYIGNSLMMIVVCGTVICIIVQLFLEPMLRFFGSPENVLGYAKTYTRITSLGFPFMILAAGGGHLIRADGSPRFAMTCNLVGAAVNTVLDAVFVFGLQWGMAGAAAATIIGQILSGSMAFHYLRHCRSVKLTKEHLKIKWLYVKRVLSLGSAPCSSQLAMMVVQIVLNKSLAYYGALSVYGEAVPLACAGIIMKVNQFFFSFPVGISQGMQPIVSFNYGAENFNRVKLAYKKAITYGFGIALFAFLMFQLAPRQIISIFGDGSEEYYQFATSYFRIFLFFTFLNFMQPITSNFFTAIGKPVKGMFLSLTRQILFLLPLILLLPMFMGIDGILYAGPIADFMAGITAILMAVTELKMSKYAVLVSKGSDQ